MSRGSLTERLAGACSRRPGRTVAVWLGVLVAAFACIVVFLPTALSSEFTQTNDPESVRADRLIEEHFPKPNEVDELVVVRSDTQTIDDPAFAGAVGALADAIRAVDGVAAVASPVGGGEEAMPLVSEDRSAALLVVAMAGDADDAEENVPDVIDLVQAADGQGGRDVTITGEASSGIDMMELALEDLRVGELYFGLPVALVILVLVFGALVAAAVPVILALVSILVAVALAALLGQGIELSFFVVNMITGMGLALGIDYSLFILSRYREERGRGRPKLDAISVSGATASRAVLFSGVAFTVALLGMLLVPTSVLQSLAIGAILVGLVAVAAALTLLPALLSLLGDRVNALRVPVLGRVATSGAEAAESRFWGWTARGVMRRPVLSLVLSVGVLLACAAPILALETGANSISVMPERLPATQGYLALTEEFPTATSYPVEIVIDGDADDPAVRSAIERVEAGVAGNELFGPPELQVAESGEAALLEVPVGGDPEATPAVDAVRELRRDLVPAAFEGTGVEALVGGKTSGAVDSFDATRTWLPRVIVFVLGLSLILLTIAFRSIVVAAKAIALNLLSVGAAYGLLVLVFQKGVGNELFGFRQVDTIETWVPLFLFSVLFGLSMDYHVFLLSRIRERFGHSGDNSEAVLYGVSTTARLITGAALIMIAVFAGFAVGDLVMFQQMGFGIAVALFLDATIVRSVLVPAAMELLGGRNWYLPGWLLWLPDVGVEGSAPAERGPGRAVPGS